MAILFLLDGVQALIFNFRNDSRAIKEGEPPIPLSGYFFLGLRYVVRGGLSILLAFIVAQPFLSKSLTLILLYFLVIFLTSLVETGVRFLMVKHYANELKESGLEPEEKETN